MTAEPLPYAKYSVLVAGAGSIGRRHMANLRQLGVEQLAATDPDASRLEPAAAQFGVESFSNFATALSSFGPDVVFVCTPPALHVDQALAALRFGADVFIEKPLSHNLDNLAELKSCAETNRRIVQVGYNLRFHPGVQALKRLLEENVAGKIQYIRAEVAQYLPDWRPWQDYRQAYTARRELGGGIILDASHEIDYLLWLFGPPRELVCMAGRVSALDVDVEDCATMLLRLGSGAQVDLHMDFVQRTASRSCSVMGDQARVDWNYAHNEVRIVRPDKTSECVKYDFEVNDMYMSEVRNFFSHVHQHTTNNDSLKSSELTLGVALAALNSAAERKWVTFEQ